MPALALVAIFLAAAAVIWAAGIKLSDATDALDARLGLGSALGGLLVLAIATNLPEIAITVTAAAAGNVGLAVGNLVGGIAIQTLVLALLDARAGRVPLTYRVGSLTVVLEAGIVLATVTAAVGTAQLPSSAAVAGISPGSVAILAIWLGGLAIVNAARAGLPWKASAPGASAGRSATDRAKGAEPQPFKGRSTGFVVGVLAAASIATLAGGIAIEETGSRLAEDIGLTGAVFGATILAASTALPEVSTGLASIKLGDYGLAFSDIFGGNAFLPVLFLLADAVAGTPALPSAQRTDVWMAALGILLTAIYVVGLVLRPRRKIAGLGVDSLVAVVAYAVGIVGLATI